MPAAVAPVAAEYLPAPQAVHSSPPMAVLYFPASHKAHDCAFGPVEPAGQCGATQFARAVLPAGELEPAGQATHVDA